MQRFKGTLSKNVKPSYAYIKFDTVTNINGSPANLTTTKDIFLSADDVNSPLRPGMEVSFAVVEDHRRSNAYRAYAAQQTTASLRLLAGPSLELHTMDTRIENPSVPIRWCFTGALHNRVQKGLTDGNGYAALLVARRMNDVTGHYEQRDVVDPFQPFTILTFPKPGTWQVALILFERPCAYDGKNESQRLNRAMRSAFLERERHDRLSYKRRITNFDDLRLVGEPGATFVVDDCGWPHYGMAISIFTLNIEVPADVFAPEPSLAVKAYANYFFRARAEDECDLRRRLLIMVPGFVPWFLMEALKRFVSLLIGIILVLWCMKGSLKALGHAFSPAVSFQISQGFEYLEEGCAPDSELRGYLLVGIWNRKYGTLWTPLALLVYAILIPIAIGFLILLGNVFWVTIGTSTMKHVLQHPEFKAHTGLTGGLLTGISILAFLFGLDRLIKLVVTLKKRRGKKTIQAIAARRKRERERQSLREQAARQASIERGKATAALVERQASALVCGDAPREVSLKAIPRELQNLTMWFRSFKRAVCRPFG